MRYFCFFPSPFIFRFSSSNRDLVFPGGSDIKESVCSAGDPGLIPGIPLEKRMATHSSALAGESRGQGNLAGHSPWGHKESNMTERMTLLFFFAIKTYFSFKRYNWSGTSYYCFRKTLQLSDLTLLTVAYTVASPQISGPWVPEWLVCGVSSLWGDTKLWKRTFYILKQTVLTLSEFPSKWKVQGHRIFLSAGEATLQTLGLLWWNCPPLLKRWRKAEYWRKQRARHFWTPDNLTTLLSPKCSGGGEKIPRFSFLERTLILLDYRSLHMHSI